MISYLKQQRCKHDSTIPELRYLEALGQHFQQLLRLRGTDPLCTTSVQKKVNSFFLGGGELGYFFFDIELQGGFVGFGD